MEYKLICGKSEEELKKFPDNHFDSIVTDPPAGISFMGKKWDSDKGGKSEWIKYMSEIASECLRVLKPGGHALVWSLPRTSHWTATAWEDGGFEIRDCIYHIFGSGFPKSLDISKQLDKGNERKIIGVNPSSRPNSKKKGGMAFDSHLGTEGAGEQLITEPATPEAKQWEGWGTALKPAAECWWLLRKPLSEKNIAENVLKHGTGGINIDGGRIETGENLNGGAYAIDGNRLDLPGAKRSDKAAGMMAKGKTCDIEYIQPQGRFPANVILDEKAGEMLDEQSGELRSGSRNGEYSSESIVYGKYGNKTLELKSSKGGASRFFYCAKTSSQDRDEGLGDFPDRILAMSNQAKAEHARGVICKDDKGFNGVNIKKNNHATVKSTKLMRYFVRLITPPGGHCLDPFNGSGSTGKGCVFEGFDYTGIDMEKENIEISEARIKYAIYIMNGGEPIKVSKVQPVEEQPDPEIQMGFDF